MDHATLLRTGAVPPPPWYRQRWPWLLIAGPALVVVAAFFTLWLSVSSDDGVIADDYYKRGLLINTDAAALPDAVTLKLVHPTRAGQDRQVTLVHGPGNSYIGDLGSSPQGRWLVSVETPEWRLPATEVAGGLAEATLAVGHAAN